MTKQGGGVGKVGKKVAEEREKRKWNGGNRGRVEGVGGETGSRGLDEPRSRGWRSQRGHGPDCHAG